MFFIETNYKNIESIEDAKAKLNKIKRGRSEADFMDWFKHILKLLALGGGWLHLLLLGLSDFMAMPGSAKDKVRRINQLITATNKALAYAESDDSKESKAAVADYKKFLKELEDEKQKLIRRSDAAGNFMGNFKESVDLFFDFDIL